MKIPAYRRDRLAAFFRMLRQAGLVMPPAADALSKTPSD